MKLCRIGIHSWSKFTVELVRETYKIIGLSVFTQSVYKNKRVCKCCGKTQYKDIK